MVIEWPQIIWFGLVAFCLVWEAANDGSPKTGKHNLALSMLAYGLSFGLMWWGGFFRLAS